MDWSLQGLVHLAVCLCVGYFIYYIAEHCLKYKVPITKFSLSLIAWLSAQSLFSTTLIIHKNSHIGVWMSRNLKKGQLTRSGLKELLRSGLVIGTSFFVRAHRVDEARGPDVHF